MLRESIENIEKMSLNTALRDHSLAWHLDATKHQYCYNFEWQGRPIIQYPQDMIAMQELIWLIKPDLIIETGIAHGGSLIFNASMLALLDLTDAIEFGATMQANTSARKVLGIDIDIRSHNRDAIERHPMSSRIQMIQGSSIDPSVVAQVTAIAARFSRILVCLDSNHTHQHVLDELKAYGNLVTTGSYCVVFDTIIDDMPSSAFADRPWGPGNSPKTAVREFLKARPDFVIDKVIEEKLLITVAPDGYLKKL